jgi:hypothetical protein
MSPSRPDPQRRASPAPATTTAGGVSDVDRGAALDEARYEEAVSTAAVDRRLLRGPFASNVWGGRYEIHALGGRGAQGTTFRGLDRRTGARVAVKLFDLGRAKHWKAQELFDREVATLQKLSHPGVPRFVDVVADEDTGARALIMGFVDGESFADALQREGPLPEKRLWPLLHDAAQVLAAVHGEGVVHRDIKPANLIRRPDGGVALVDFGGVGAVRAEAGSTVVGTFGYMAPEQLYGAQTSATDLYALGATLLHLATGKAPEEQPRRGLAIDVDAAAPTLSPPLRALLGRMLSPDPQGRPADAAALLRELHGLSNAPPPPRPVVIDDRAVVQAVWREDETRRALELTGGVFGVLAAVVGVLAAVGVGRLLLPVLLTVLSVFLDGEQRRQLRSVRDVVVRRSTVVQRRFERVGVDSAGTLERVAAEQRDALEGRKHRRGRKQRRQELASAALDDERAVPRHEGFWRL